MNSVVLGVALFAAELLPVRATAQEISDVKSSQPLTLKQQGSFYVGGNTHFVDDAFTGSNPGRLGNSMINQMYVQFQKPAAKSHQFPIVFVHGCCLSSKTWETTPDGRMGWYEYFTRKGFDTYMADQVGRARSGFDALQYNKVQAGAAPASSNPRVLIATDKFAWDVFRFGDFATKTPWPDERFPMNTVGVGAGSTLTFYKQVLPDMTSTLTAAVPGCAGGNCGPTAPDAFWHSPASMAQLAKDLGGAILVSLPVELIPDSGGSAGPDRSQRDHSAGDRLLRQPHRGEHQRSEEHPDSDHGGRPLSHGAPGRALPQRDRAAQSCRR